MKISRYLVVLFIFLSSPVFSEDIILSTPGDISPESHMKVTSIDSQSGKILDSQDTNIISSAVYFNDMVEMGRVGTTIIWKDKDLYRLSNGYYQKVDFQVEEATPPVYVDLVISPDESVIVEKRYDNESKKMQLLFYDAKTLAVIAKHEIEFSYSDILMDADANVLLYYVNNSWRIIERTGEMFSEYITTIFFVDSYSLRVSSDGKRVVFLKYLGEDKYKIAYIDRLESGWSDPIEIPLADEEGTEIIFKFSMALCDITEDGKTILFYKKNYFSQPSLIQEKEGEWSEPQTLDFEWNHDHGYADNYSISKDGKVIAVRDMVEERGDVFPYVNIYVLTKSPNGDWEEHKINPDGNVAIPSSYLTNDGSKLFWLPEGKSSVKGGMGGGGGAISSEPYIPTGARELVVDVNVSYKIK